MSKNLPPDKPGDYAGGYAKGHGDKKDGVIEYAHEAVGLTKSDSEKSEAFQKGKEQGERDKKAGK